MGADTAPGCCHGEAGGNDETVYLDEDEPLRTARLHANELGGCVPIGAGGGMTLRFLAASVAAKAVVEIGTGCGTSGLWLLRGMRPDGILTTVDVEPGWQ